LDAAWFKLFGSNFGVGGAAVELDSGKPYMNQSEFQNAKEFKPNIVIIMLGTNDANPALKQNASNFVADYSQLIDAFQSLASKPKYGLLSHRLFLMMEQVSAQKGSKFM